MLPTPSTSTSSRTCSGVIREDRTVPCSAPAGLTTSAERRIATAAAGSSPAAASRWTAACAVEHPGVAEEERRRRVDGSAPDVVDRALLHDPAVPHHRDPVGDRERLLVVVGDHQGGGPGRAKDPAQLGRQPLAQAGVEGGQRLVQQQQPGLHGQRPGQRDPLPLAAGQGPGQPVAVPLEADQREQLVDPGADVSFASQPQRVADVAGDRQVPEQLAVLEHQGEPALVGGYAGEVGAVPRDAAGGHRLQPGDRPQQRGLAAAGGAEDGEHLAVGEVERDVDDGGLAVVADRDVAEPEHHIAPREGTRSRSTASTTRAVVAASTTDAASAMP